MINNQLVIYWNKVLEHLRHSTINVTLKILKNKVKTEIYKKNQWNTPKLIKKKNYEKPKII